MLHFILSHCAFRQRTSLQSYLSSPRSSAHHCHHPADHDASCDAPSIRPRWSRQEGYGTLSQSTNKISGFHTHCSSCLSVTLWGLLARTQIYYLWSALELGQLHKMCARIWVYVQVLCSSAAAVLLLDNLQRCHSEYLNEVFYKTAVMTVKPRFCNWHSATFYYVITCNLVQRVKKCNK